MEKLNYVPNKYFEGVDRLFISFSGGRTSAYMTKKLLESVPDWVETKILFANTGQEHEKTLKFIKNCEDYFDWDVNWVETVVHQNQRKGSTHRLVNYDTATRNTYNFEQVIQKYGIPNQAMPHCTRELKIQPMKSFMRSIGWKTNSYHTAIGIRADEIDRMSVYADKNKIIYPLVGMGVTKQDVLEFWKTQPFDLNLPEHKGNCVWCWKKSFRKLAAVMQEEPEWFTGVERMEKEYAHCGPMAKKTGEPQKFFRGKHTVKDIKNMIEEGINIYEDPWYKNECAESCEVFSDSQIENWNYEEN